MISARRTILLLANAALVGCLFSVMQGSQTEVEASHASRSETRGSNSQETAELEALAVSAELGLLFRVRPPTQAVAAPAPVTAPAAPKFRLAGVVWSKWERVAIFQLFDGGKHRRVRFGEAVDGWTLREMTPKSAVVEAGEARVELPLAARPARLSD